MRTSILSLFSSSPSSLLSTPLLTQNLHQYDNEEELIWTEKIDEECSINNDDDDDGDEEYTYCDIVDCDSDDEDTPTVNNCNGNDDNVIPVFTSKRMNPKDREPSKLSSMSSIDTNEPNSFSQWCWGDDGIIQRWYPPFHVTAIYLWTQFNVSFILQFFQFLFQPNTTNDSITTTATTSSSSSALSTNDENYDSSSRHIATIHYYETGISDIIVMNLIVLLFLTTAWMYRSKQYKVCTNHVTETTTTTTTPATAAALPCFVPELITTMTFIALMMRLRITAINILVVSTIYMFVRIVFWTYRSLTW